MKKLAIADITTITYNQIIYGHFLKLARQYLNIFDKDFNTSVYGGITYKKYINNTKYKELPFFISVEELHAKKAKKIVMKIKEVINAIVMLHSGQDIIIFQCFSEMPVLLALLITNIQSKKIFMIQYQKGLQTKYSHRVYKKVSKKISGIITSSASVGEYYGINYIIVPDYLPSKNIDKKYEEYLYDFVVLGTVSDWKDYENVVFSLRNTKYKIKIAGKFFDKRRLKYLKEHASYNIEIEDKYLTEEEYNKYISKSKFVILPYKKNYDEKSSGVVLDAIYHGTPVIASSLKSFQFIKDEGVGLLYKNSITDVIEEVQKVSYEKFKNNILMFINKKNKKKQELIEFLKN